MACMGELACTLRTSCTYRTRTVHAHLRGGEAEQLGRRPGLLRAVSQRSVQGAHLGGRWRGVTRVRVGRRRRGGACGACGACGVAAHRDAAHVDLQHELGAVARGAQVLAQRGAEPAHDELARHGLERALQHEAHHGLLRGGGGARVALHLVARLGAEVEQLDAEVALEPPRATRRAVHQRDVREEARRHVHALEREVGRERDAEHLAPRVHGEALAQEAEQPARLLANALAVALPHQPHRGRLLRAVGGDARPDVQAHRASELLDDQLLEAEEVVLV